ncbi:serine hydrolase [Winogradskyella sp.]|uniref:serine hydrolase domain-containing protein n=1 Tax=Winogradskyella sp. TaxID=1883156 RepID=UPI002626F810|nr:serine hydrolase domain-containing protein [Winogradskyella sp.]
MKTTILLIGLILSIPLHSQDLEKRIQQVENNLIFPTLITDTSPLTTNTIYDQLKKHKIHGASIAVINKGKIDWSKGYGYCNQDKTKTISTQTLFQSASIGKIISSLVSLKLVEQGQIDLDKNVNLYLKRWKLEENSFTKDQPVTLRHLLTHSAGLTDDYGFLGYKPTDDIPSLLQILNNESPAKTRKSLSIKTKPGTKERYSGGGYLIIQLLVEDVSGIPFEEYVEQHIFEPLQMTNSTYNYSPDINLGKPIADGHLYNGKSLKKKKYHIYPEKGAAGPWTTAEDLAKLVIGIQTNRILNSQLTQEMMTPQINNKGLGVNLKGIDKAYMFWHAGQNLGYTALVYGSIEGGDGAVVLVNSDGGEQFLQELMSSISTVYNWPVMKSYNTIEISEQEIELLEGTYENQGTRLFIKLRKGKLFVQPENSKERVQLYKIQENHFTFKGAQDFYKLSFKYQNKVVTGLVYAESIGKILTLKKL